MLWTFKEVIRVALRALARNKLRTILTMLGIIIGVGAVICTVAIGQGAGQQVQQQIQSLGNNMIMIFSGSVNTGGVRMGNGANKTLTADDAEAILQHVPDVVAVSPMVGASVQVVNGNQNWFTRANGAPRMSTPYATGPSSPAACFLSATWTWPPTSAWLATLSRNSSSATRIPWDK